MSLGFSGPLVLASGSPRRQELLHDAGYSFDMIVPEVDEAFNTQATPEELTVANASLKAAAGLALRPGSLVIGADTLVYLDGQPFGKPADLEEARGMLRRLSGRPHQVCTGVALADDSGIESFAVITHVIFLTLSDEMIADYLDRVEVLDKAGGYAIQEHGDMIVQSIHGSLTNVVGLPMEELTLRLDARMAG